MIDSQKDCPEMDYDARSLVRLELIVVQFVIMKIVFKFKIIPHLKMLIPSVCGSIIMSLLAIGLQKVGDAIIWQLVSAVLCMIIYFLALYIMWKKELLSALNTVGIKINFKES